MNELFTLKQLRAATEEDVRYAQACAQTEATSEAIRHLSANLYKKAVCGCSPCDRTSYAAFAAARRSSAIDIFVETNRRMRFANEVIRCSSSLSFLCEHHQLALGHAREVLTRWCGELDTRLSDPTVVLAPVLRVGPGAALDAKAFNAYAKIWDSPLSFPSILAVRLYEGLTADNQLLSRAEAIRANVHGAPYVRPAARFSSVPKDSSKDRSIIIPTNGGSMLARAAGILLEEILAKIGMPIYTQPVRNRALAYKGSIDGSFSTIDLSNASDLISYELVCWMLADVPNVSRLLCCLRDTHVDIRRETDVERVKLEAFSGMGNGFTFPLQTLIFSALAFGLQQARIELYRSFGAKPPPKPRQWLGVFGDDIAIAAAADPDDLIGLLGCLFMEPNPAKSYTTGPFRESCGTDWMNGFNIRSPYARDLRDASDRLSLLNQLLAWCAWWNVKLPRTIEMLRLSIPKRLLNAVPLWEASDSGLRLPSGLVAMRGGAYAPWRKQSARYSLHEEGAVFEIECSLSTGAHRKPRTVRIVNPDGYLAYVLLGGEARHYAVERSSRSRYKTHPATTVNWDFPTSEYMSPVKLAAITHEVGSPELRSLFESSIDRRVSREFTLPGSPGEWHSYWARLATSPMFLHGIEEVPHRI